VITATGKWLEPVPCLHGIENRGDTACSWMGARS